MEKQNRKGIFFIAVVAAFGVFNWWAFMELEDVTHKAPFEGFRGQGPSSGAVASYEAKVGSQRQFIYIGNGVLALLSLGGYSLFLKEQKS